jgi:hypothetical protein
LNNILKQRLAAQQTAQSEHPSADTLAAFAEQNLRVAQREAVLRHLAACADCRQAVMLATSEVPGKQTAAGPFRTPVFQFPAAMRWASLAAALAVAVGVGLLVNEHESATRQAASQQTVPSVSASPSAPPAQEAAKPELQTKNLEAKNEVLRASPASTPTTLNEKKKLNLATSRDRLSPPAANVAGATTAARVESAGRLSDNVGLNQETANSFVPNQDSDQKRAANAAKAAPAAQVTPAPSAPPPSAAEAYYGQTSDNFRGGAVARTQPQASAKQPVEVLQGAVTDPNGAAVGGAEVTIRNVATGVTRVVKSGSDGNYRVDPIPAGIYRMEVVSPGFTTATAERVETPVGASTTQNFQLQVGAATETVAVSAQAPVIAAKTEVSQNDTTAEVSGRSQAEMVQIPSKTPPAAAVSGRLRKVQAAQLHAGIVNWAISDTGQLQRTLSDGATANIQPAPGMTVKAVAAQGIEVWAAGTEADLAAKDETQRSVLFHSSDAGKTWSRIDGPWQAPITQLSLSSKGNLTVVTQNGMWATNDAGKTWTAVKTKG